MDFRVFEQLFALLHETEWITWHALNHPAAVTDSMVNSYNAAVHTAYPKALGAMSVVASMDIALFAQLWTHIDALYEFEGHVGELALRVPNEDALSQLAAMNVEAKALYVSLPAALAAAMAGARATDSLT